MIAFTLFCDNFHFKAINISFSPAVLCDLDVTLVNKYNWNEGYIETKKCFKIAAMIFTMQTAIGPGLWLSNEILCILAAQRAAELQVVKVEGPKKSLRVSGKFLFKETYCLSHIRKCFRPIIFDTLLFFSPLRCKNVWYLIWKSQTRTNSWLLSKDCISFLGHSSFVSKYSHFNCT